MKRRDFLKLAVGALAALGLKVKGETESTPETVEAFELSPAPEWATDGITFKSSGDIGKYWGEIDADTRPLYVCATNDSVFIESFDGGLTWSKTDVHLT